MQSDLHNTAASSPWLHNLNSAVPDPEKDHVDRHDIASNSDDSVHARCVLFLNFAHRANKANNDTNTVNLQTLAVHFHGSSAKGTVANARHLLDRHTVFESIPGHLFSRRV